MRATIQHHSQHAVANRAGQAGAFSDARVFLAAPYDQRLAIIGELDSEHCQVQQQDDGPTYLVIGPNVTDQSLLRAAGRFGIPMADLIEFRAATEDITKMPVWRPVIEVITSDGGHRFEQLGEPMPKQKAWDVARAAMDSRDDAVSMSVRRECDRRFDAARRGGKQ